MKVGLRTLLLPASLIALLFNAPPITGQEPGIKLGVGDSGIGIGDVPALTGCA